MGGLILSIVILVQGGADGLSTASFRPSEFMSGNPSLALMWGMAGYAGFESTVIYRDEARDAERTIPRATYGALILIALFYTFASWALVQAWGSSFDEEVAGATSNFVVASADRYVGGVGSEIVNVLLLTSFFACVLSFHNVIARYQHAMANSGLMPRRVGKVHVRHQSPYISSLSLTVTFLLLVSLFALIQLDPYLEVYTWFGGVATVAIVLLMALTSVAVIVYLNRENVPEGLWKTWIAPTIGLIGLLFVAFLLLKNLPMLLGDVDAEGRQQIGGLSISIYVLIVAFPMFGLIQAFWLRRFRPAEYRDVIDSASM